MTLALIENEKPVVCVNNIIKSCICQREVILSLELVVTTCRDYQHASELVSVNTNPVNL
ncbi:MAG: hypothetical protein CM15mP85_30750 [Rhodobacterales bacterium]|nr:MAG: hypothetical protein CM15mP85_30750 [Rhodobacterales bacterium]